MFQRAVASAPPIAPRMADAMAITILIRMLSVVLFVFFMVKRG